MERGFKKLGTRPDAGYGAAVAFLVGIEVEYGTISSYLERERLRADCLEVMDRYKIPEDYVSPRLLVRHALALMISYKDVIKTLERCKGRSVTDTLILERGRLLADTVEKAYQIDDAEADHLLATIFRGRPEL
jgi:hypothetical protein